MSYQARNAKRAALDTFEARNVKERGPCVNQNPHRNWSFSTVEVLHAFCEVNSIQLDWANEYGEPGYTASEKGILFSDWNEVPKALQDRLEKQGYELEWSDEWYVDSDNSPVKAWRTEPDSHGWESRVRAMDGYMITPDSDPQEWVDSALNEEGRPLPSWFDESELETRGFGELAGRDRAVGFHPGQDETPDKVMPSLIEEGYDVILQVTDRGQFDAHYKVWTRREAKRELFLSEDRGVYIPRDFAQEVKRGCVTGVDGHDWLILEAGPDHELYWEVWLEVINNAVITTPEGVVYTLEQDGDCWLVEQGAELCEQDDTYYVHK